MKKILIVTTNADKINDEIPTGVYFEEFAVPFLTFQNAGYEITVASPKGGVSPIDPSSLYCESPTEWDSTKQLLDNTFKLDELDYKSFDAVFFPGGHGVMFDLFDNKRLAEILKYFNENKKIIAAVCHGAAALLNAKEIIQGKKITAFSNEEEHVTKLDEFMPFSLEEKLKEAGAELIFANPFRENVVQDGNIITGQNPKSSQLLADTIWKRFMN